MQIVKNEDGSLKLIRSTHKDEPDDNKKNTLKFYDIPYLKAEVLDTFAPNEEVWIEEKIDGTNVSCEVDHEGNYRCYGRRFELGEWYTNIGAYEKLLEIEDRVRDAIGTRYKLFFEYLRLHHVRYSPDKENGIYLIGVRDKAAGKWLTPDKVQAWAYQLDLDTPALLYHGPFKDWEHVKGLVGESRFGAKQGEGVIVKASDTKRGIKMVKVVADDFREIMKYDPARVQAKMDAELAKREKAKEIVTEARIRKQLYNMVDEGVISTVEGMTKEDKVNAIKNIGKRVYEDCVKEELDFVLNFGKDFGKYSFIISKQYIEGLN